jgi:hypothetical protein
MKLSVAEAGHLLFEDVFNGVELKSPAGETMGISMRDSGFEFVYQGLWYEAKGGVVKLMGTEMHKK